MRRQSHIILLLAALIALVATGASAASHRGRKGATASSATEWAGYHTVRKGDTVATIAKANDLSIDELKQLNPGKKLDRLKPGMRVRIKAILEKATASAAPVVAPEPAATAQADPEPRKVSKAPEPVPAAPAVESVEAPAGNAAYHTVRKGDTFATVAKANGLSVEELKRLNAGKDSRRLKIGTRLCVKSGADAPPAAKTVAKPVEKAVEIAAEKKAEKKATEVAVEKPSEKASEKTESEPVSAKAVYHKVHKGETYASIASKYGVSVKTLKKLNHIRKNRKLKPGSQLLVRRGSAGGPISADRRRELEKILQNEASLTAEGAALAAAQVTEMAPELLAAAGDNAIGGPIVEESVSSGIAGRVIRIAKLMLDLPYRFGGTSLTGIDCSGYVQKVFGFLNMPLPRSAREQFAKGEKIDKGALATGDLVFFKTYARFPSHVGIYLGDNKFIHASSGDHKVKIDSLDAPYFLRRYIGARRLVTDQKDDEE